MSSAIAPQPDPLVDRNPLPSWRLAALLALALAAVYALPAVLGLVFQHHVPDITEYDDRFYLARIVDAYRGGSLANPYLADHENAPRYTPEMAERAIAFAAHICGVSSFAVAALSRILLPPVVFLLLWKLAVTLGIHPRIGLLAPLLPLLMPSLTRSFVPRDPSVLGLLRYNRLVSPVFHVLLLVFALWMVQRAWSRSSPMRILLAGAALGLLFYQPVYYWAFAIGGSALLGLSSRRAPRIAVWMAAALGLLLGLPALYRSYSLVSVPEVRDTLARVQLMVPSHRPPALEIALAFLTSVAALVLWRRRREAGLAAQFLLPILGAGALLFLQSLVTGRQIQEFHWAHCVTPLAYLGLSAAFQQSLLRVRPAVFGALLLALFLAGGATQLNGYRSWVIGRKLEPLYWSLDSAMPRTLEWLRQNARSDRVVLTRDPELSENLVLYAPVKVYWSAFAAQHVLSDGESALREQGSAWTPRHPTSLAYRADFFLGIGEECRGSVVPVLFADAGERTCVVRIAASAAR